jgi:hypothetical protein
MCSVPAIQIQQLVHGYRRGHELLAGSIRLGPEDQDLVTRLSDLSGTLGTLTFDSYITAYPLPSGEYYAIARTWPDSAASRPGCVLTHTLLTRLSDWGDLQDPSRINRCFVHPRASNADHYRSPVRLSQADEDILLSMSGSQSKRGSDDQSQGAIRLTVSGFCEKFFLQSTRPVVSFDSQNAEAVLWRILNALWPRLRISFSACTFALQPRTLPTGAFHLMCAPVGSSSRFVKYSSEHVIETVLNAPQSRRQSPPWLMDLTARITDCERLPESPEENELWSALDDDPTLISQFFLLRTLRQRAPSYTTAALGAMDVVGSLVPDPSRAVLLKRSLAEEVLEPRPSCGVAEEVANLCLLNDRLNRPPFASIRQELSSQVECRISAHVAKQVCSVLRVVADLCTQGQVVTPSAFTSGLLKGLVAASEDGPCQASIVAEYPEIVACLLQQDPTLGADVVHRCIGGNWNAHLVHRLTQWFSTTHNRASVQSVRLRLLPFACAKSDAGLLSVLLSQLAGPEVEPVLVTLSQSQCADYEAGWATVLDLLCRPFADVVQEWARVTHLWSSSGALLFAGSYPLEQHGLHELRASRLPEHRRPDALIMFLRLVTRERVPYWLIEEVRDQPDVLEELLCDRGDLAEFAWKSISSLLPVLRGTSSALSRKLIEALASSAGDANSADLLAAVMPSAINQFVRGAIDANDYCRLQDSAASLPWLECLEISDLEDLLTRGYWQHKGAFQRAWKWLEIAPESFYRSRGSTIGQVIGRLLSLNYGEWPPDIANVWVRVLRRTRHEAGEKSYRLLCGQAVKFAFDNVALPVGVLVAEAFYSVYEEVTGSEQPASELDGWLGIFGWDKGKELRRALVSAFLRSEWLPSHLALAAKEPSLLRKIFKRLLRQSRGHSYALRVFQGLGAPADPKANKLREIWGDMLAQPHFSEEWD